MEFKDFIDELIFNSLIRDYSHIIKYYGYSIVKEEKSKIKNIKAYIVIECIK